MICGRGYDNFGARPEVSNFRSSSKVTPRVIWKRPRPTTTKQSGHLESASRKTQLQPAVRRRRPRVAAGVSPVAPRALHLGLALVPAGAARVLAAAGVPLAARCAAGVLLLRPASLLRVPVPGRVEREELPRARVAARFPRAAASAGSRGTNAMSVYGGGQLGIGVRGRGDG